MLQILDRLREIELEVLAKDSEAENLHVGSVKLFMGIGAKRGGRQGVGPPIPSFEQGGGGEASGAKEGKKKKTPKGPRAPGEGSEDSGETTPEETSEDEELMEAIESLKIIPSRTSSDESSRHAAEGPGTQRPFAAMHDTLSLQRRRMKDADPSEESTLSGEPLLHRDIPGSIAYTDYSTSVVRKANGGAPPTLSSVLTVRPLGKKDGNAVDEEPEPISQSGFKTLTTDSKVSVESYHTADGGTTSSFVTNPYASRRVF